MPAVKRADRKELAVLGLVVLGWGLLVGPLLHRETHSHGVAHSHGTPAKKQTPASDQHGVGSVEHQAVAFTSAPAAPALALVLLPLQSSQQLAPFAPSVSAQRRVEQSQAP